MNILTRQLLLRIIKKISQPTNASFLYKTDPILQVSQTQHSYSRALTSPDIYRQPTVPHEEELSIQKPIVQGSSVENILGVCIQRFNDCHIESNIHGKGTCKLSTIVLEYAKIYEPLAFAVGNLGSKWLPTLQPDLSEMFVDFKIKALNLLRQDLAYRGISEPSLLCMLILGIIEMNEFNNEAWNQHLDGSAKGITDMLQKKARYNGKSRQLSQLCYYSRQHGFTRHHICSCHYLQASDVSYLPVLSIKASN